MLTFSGLIVIIEYIKEIIRQQECAIGKIDIIIGSLGEKVLLVLVLKTVQRQIDMPILKKSKKSEIFDTK